jgi:hypothetical protein
MRVGRSILAVLAAAATLAVVAGCGSDSSGQDGTVASTPTEVSIQSPTSPIPVSTDSTSATTTSGGGKKKPVQTTSTTSGGGAATCAIPDAFQDFKYTGLDCQTAVIIAQAWDANGKTCNTVDNPNVDAGYKRSCSIEGFNCLAKRDIHSDNRFVTCTQGGRSVRFTWLPA